ncbi:hypothetical protein Hanom_Chr16g01441741 [Helianthus anomalus]
MIKDFWLSMKVNGGGAEGAGSIKAKIPEQEIVITEKIVDEVLKFGDQHNHPKTFEKDKVMKALGRMSYEGVYPTMLKKLFPLCWRLLVHVFLVCISENKVGLNQLKMLENPKNMICMLYPWFIQMILDEKYPKLVKSTNVLNLKPMDPNCFDTVKRNRETAKRHQFLGK